MWNAVSSAVADLRGTREEEGHNRPESKKGGVKERGIDRRDLL